MIMKELSIEEKAKAYDEAIEKAKELHSKFKGITARNVVEEIFPELKESEDEKIRKALIKAIKMKAFPTSTCGGELFICGQSSDKCIAWLEKQGENSSNIGNDGKIADIIREALANVTSQNVLGKYELTFDDVSDWLDEQPADKKELKEIENNLAWSEDDEINYNYALAACKYYGEAKGYADTETHQKANNWLKSIKERLQSQNTWKPSDEQMRCLCGVLNNSTGNIYNILKSLFDDLKKLNTITYFQDIFLKERYYAWKPSDEQIEQLEWVAKQNKDNLIGKELMTLFNDLKKL